MRRSRRPSRIYSRSPVLGSNPSGHQLELHDLHQRLLFRGFRELVSRASLVAASRRPEQTRSLSRARARNRSRT